MSNPNREGGFAEAYRRVGSIAALLLLSSLLTFGATRQESLPASSAAISRDHDSVVFGGDVAYAPFTFVDESGVPDGFDVELFKAIARHSDLQPDYRMENWAKLIDGLSSGEVDVVPMLVSDRRSERFLFSDPIISRHYRVFGRKNSEFIVDLESLNGRRVASVRSGLAWEELRIYQGVDLVSTKSEEGALRAVALGRADYAVVELLVGQAAIQKNRWPDIVPLSAPLLRSDYAFAVTPTRPDLLIKINSGLREATRKGEWSQIQLRWLANLTSPQESFKSGLARGLWTGAPFVICAIFLLWAWRRSRRRERYESLMREKAESARRELELQDAVTHLSTRLAFRHALQELIAGGRAFTLIRVDLLDLDLVETIAGHAFVDDVLAEVASRLRSSCERGLIAKVGYSGFLIARPDVVDIDAARSVMQSLREVVATRGEIRGITLEHTCTSGAALFPDHGSEADELMRASSAACAAGRHLPDRIAVYSAGIAPNPRDLTLLSELRQAVRERAIEYAVQPKLDLRTESIIGAEMLVRWEHPQHGLLLPSTFVPLAEERGVIGEMTLHLVAKAVDHCREWRRVVPGFAISVNISANDLCEAEVVGEIIRLSEGIGDGLILEITETAVMKDPASAFEAVNRLSSSGLRISLDDFGTGHSSLIYLRRLSPKEVKIDRAFVTGLRQAHEDEQIVRSIIHLSHSLGAKVVAEGVEDRSTKEWLAAEGCDYAQGYWVGRPMSPEALSELLRVASFTTGVANAVRLKAV